MNALRFPDHIAARTQPDPKFPDGPHDLLSKNYYYTRDGRREAKPPLVFVNNAKASLQSGEGADK